MYSEDVCELICIMGLILWAVVAIRMGINSGQPRGVVARAAAPVVLVIALQSLLLRADMRRHAAQWDGKQGEPLRDLRQRDYNHQTDVRRLADRAGKFFSALIYMNLDLLSQPSMTSTIIKLVIRLILEYIN